MWSEEDDAILGGDLTAALAYVTPAGGVVLTPVAPVGLRDRDAGTVSFTTSLGFGRKLDRIKENPRVSLAYHAREHGFASDPRFVLVQGTASYDAHPDRRVLDETIGYARELASSSSPASMATMKRQVYADLQRDLPQALEDADRLMLESFGAPDFVEGVNSFLERRDPRFPPLGS